MPKWKIYPKLPVLIFALLYTMKGQGRKKQGSAEFHGVLSMSKQYTDTWIPLFLSSFSVLQLFKELMTNLFIMKS